MKKNGLDSDEEGTKDAWKNHFIWNGVLEKNFTDTKDCEKDKQMGAQ